MKRSTAKDQFIAILENIRHDFKIFGESLMALNKKVNKIQETVDEHSIKLDAISGSVKQQSKILDEHTKDLGFIKSQLGIQRSGAQSIAPAERISRLERRVTRLEQRI